MAQVLVRDLDEKTLKRLKARAEVHGRSLQGEVKAILEEAANREVIDRRAIIERVRKRFAGRQFEDSVPLIRKDRER